jgi:hypothetical protein
MLSCLKHGQLPGVNEEGATGKSDNKGAIFIPGGLIYQDVEDNQISYESSDSLDEAGFRKKIRASMHYDNATLMYPDGVAVSINLDREQIFAKYGGVSALGVLRTYSPTSPGSRSSKYRLDLISPEKDVNIDLNRIAARARERYHIKENQT